MKKHPTILFIFLFALFSIYAIAGSDPLINVPNYPLEYCFKQIQWYMIALIGIYIITRFNNKEIYRFSKPIYFFFLLAVWLLAIQHQLYGLGMEQKIIPFSQSVNGATAWYHFPGIGTIQPSEFLKMAYLLYLAQIIDKHHQKYPKQTNKTDLLLIGKMLLLTLPAALGILLQNDSGVMMILLVGFLFMFFASGISKIYLISMILGIVTFSLGIAYVLFLALKNFDITQSPYQLGRIVGWLDPERYYQSYGFQLFQALLSLSTASLFGHGFQSVVMPFPEAQTDFIFGTLVSNGGWLAGLMLIVLLTSFDLYLLQLTKKMTDKRDSYLLVGLTGLLFFQQFWNIGMVLGLLPITGITLPFISYGGSSLLSYLCMMALVINMERKVAEHPQKPSSFASQDGQKINNNYAKPAH